MGNLGTWRAPFPRRLGGRAHERISDLYATMQSNSGSALSGGEGTDVDIENKMAARMLATGYRAVDRRVAQRDPTKLSVDVREVEFPDGTVETLSMLERWERILHITPPYKAYDSERRAAVAAKLNIFRNDIVSIADAMRPIFGDWLYAVRFCSVQDVIDGLAHAHWPPGADTVNLPGEPDTADLPWHSAIAHIGVWYVAPANADLTTILKKRATAAATLDSILPAWATGDLCQIEASLGVTGFYVGVSLLGLGAL